MPAAAAADSKAVAVVDMPFVERSAVGRPVVGRPKSVEMQVAERVVESTLKAVGHTSSARTQVAADSCTAVDPSVDISPETVEVQRAAVAKRL